MLEAKGRIRLKPSCEEWVKEALATPGLALAPITPEIALESSRLPGPFHGDPADRIIVATARRMGARLMTRDQKLIQYGRKGHLAIFLARRHCGAVAAIGVHELRERVGAAGRLLLEKEFTWETAWKKLDF